MARSKFRKCGMVAALMLTFSSGIYDCGRIGDYLQASAQPKPVIGGPREYLESRARQQNDPCIDDFEKALDQPLYWYGTKQNVEYVPGYNTHEDGFPNGIPLTVSPPRLTMSFEERSSGMYRMNVGVAVQSSVNSVVYLFENSIKERLEQDVPSFVGWQDNNDQRTDIEGGNLRLSRSITFFPETEDKCFLFGIAASIACDTVEVRSVGHIEARLYPNLDMASGSIKIGGEYWIDSSMAQFIDELRARRKFDFGANTLDVSNAQNILEDISTQHNLEYLKLPDRLSFSQPKLRIGSDSRLILESVAEIDVPLKQSDVCVVREVAAEAGFGPR